MNETNVGKPFHFDVDAAMLRSLQIGMWWHTNNLGGLDVTFANLVNDLPRAGIGTFGLVQGPENVSDSVSNVRAFSNVNKGKIAKLAQTRKSIIEALQSYNPSIVASHFAFYTATALDKMRRRILVSHFHGPWSGEAREELANIHVIMTKHLIEKTVYKRSDHIITASQAFKELMIDKYNIYESKITVSAPGVDTERFNTALSKQDAREALGWPADRPILISIRRLTPRMGLDRLITAMQIVVKKVPDCLLFIGGKGQMHDMLAAQIEELNLSTNVKLLGFIPDEKLPLVMRAADINVVPSVALEGFGLTTVEALASGTPSVVSAIGGLPEIVKPLSPNLVFRSISTEDMGKQLLDILAGNVSVPNEHDCRTYATNRFNIQLATNRIAKIYRLL